MKYSPGLPEHNDNVTAGQPVREIVRILAGTAATLLLLFLCLGLLVDVVVDRMSPETEAALNRIAARAQPASGMPAVRLGGLADGLLKCAGVKAKVSIRLLDSDDPNAMVFAGGTVYVSKGLLEHVRTENGLAFVLAHELGHLANRDHLRAMGRGIALFGLAALLTGDSSGLAVLFAPLQQLGDASYSRERESAADGSALAVLQCHYGHVAGATEFFESLRAQDSTVLASHYLASHPAMQARIDALQALGRERGYKQGTPRPLGTPASWR